jgi:putative membrane protein
MMFWSDHDMSGWGYAGMAIGMVLFWVLIIVAIVALIRFSTGATQTRAIPAPPPYTESPEQVLWISSGEKPDFGGVDVRNRRPTNEQVVDDAAVDGSSHAGIAQHRPDRADGIEDRLDVGMGHPLQPVRVGGSLVDQYLVELGMSGGERWSIRACHDWLTVN